MGTLLGDWKLESRENYEQFLQELGVSPEHIIIANSFKPSISSSKDGDIYTTIFRGGPKGEEIMKFKHLEEFNHKSWTGELVKMVVNVVNPQKTITTAKSEKGEMIIIAEIVGDKMISVTKRNGGKNSVKAIYVRS